MPKVTVWIGGGTGSGKTTVTRIFAGRHGLRAARRWENRVVADNIRSWLATPHVPAVAPTAYPFACDCGARGCHALVDLPLTDYEAAGRILTTGH
jgi:hypothetical protein